MAQTIVAPSQSFPAAATLTAVYTVPGATQATVTVVACNQSATADTVRVSVAIAGAVDTSSQYLVYDVTINGNDTLTLLSGIALGAADVVRVRSTNGTTSFNLFKVQFT